MSILDLTLSGSVFILAIAAFRALALRRLPKGTFAALWWAAALRLLVPLPLPSPFSVYTLLNTLRPNVTPLDAPAAPVLPAGTTPVQIVPGAAPAAAPPVPGPVPPWWEQVKSRV